MLFDTKENDARLTGGILAWQQNNPQFRQLLDSVSRLAYNRSFETLSSDGLKQAMTYMAMTAQNSLPGMGSPVNDFVAVNRALITGGIPIISADTKASLGSAYGTGNVSTAITTQLLKNMEESFSNKDGSIDLGRTFGLSQSQRAQMLAGIVTSRGIKSGDIVQYDLSKATTSAVLEQRIKEMKENGVAQAELDDLTNIRKAMDIVERRGATDKGDIEIQTLLSNEGIESSTISKTIAQLKGKNSNLNVTTKQLKEDIHSAMTAVAENVKDLSNLFQTDDIDKIRQYAKGLGMGEVLDKERASEVRAEMREIAALSEYTGKTPQEIAAEKIQISMGLSSAMGGRAVNSRLVSVVSDAGIAAEANRNTGAFTKEESQTAAMRSVLNAQNVYKGMLQAEEVMRRLGGEENADSAIASEYRQLVDERDRAGSDKEAIAAVNRKFAKFAYKYGGDVINSKTFLQSAASHDELTVDLHQRMLADKNMSTLSKKWASRNGASEGETAQMKQVGMFLLEAFGNDDVARTKFLEDINSGDADRATAAIAKLKSAGFDANTITSTLGNISTLGMGKVRSFAMGMDTDFVQQYTGAITKQERNRLKSLQLLKQSSQADKEDSLTMRSILPGLLGEKGISEQDATDITVADAIRGNSVLAKELEQLRNGDDVNSKNSYRIGTIDKDTGQLTFKDDEKHLKDSLRSMLGLSEEAFDRMNEQEGLAGLVQLAEKKGYMLSKAVDANGHLRIVNKEYAKSRQKKLNDSATEAGIKDVVAMLGEDAVAPDAWEEDGQQKEGWAINYKGNVYRSSQEVIEAMKKNNDYSGIISAAQNGSSAAKTVASDAMKSALKSGELKDESARKMFNRFKDSKRSMSLSDYTSILEQEYGTDNIHAFDNLAYAEAEGVLTKTSDGQYITKDNRTLDKGDAKDWLQKQKESMSKHGKLLEEIEKSRKDKPPTYKQMADLLQMISSRR